MHQDSCTLLQGLSSNEEQYGIKNVLLRIHDTYQVPPKVRRLTFDESQSSDIKSSRSSEAASLDDATLASGSGHILFKHTQKISFFFPSCKIKLQFLPEYSKTEDLYILKS